MSEAKIQVRVRAEHHERWRKVADRYALPTKTWARQALRQAAGLPALGVPMAGLVEAVPSGDDSLQLVVTRTEKTAFAKAARTAGQELSAWIRLVLDRAAAL